MAHVSSHTSSQNAGARECLYYFSTKFRSSIPDSGIPCDWSILTALVSTWRSITLIGNVIGWQ